MIKVDNAMPTLPECVADAGACGVAMPGPARCRPRCCCPTRIARSFVAGSRRVPLGLATERTNARGAFIAHGVVRHR